MWKMIMIFVFFVVCNFFPDVLGRATGSNIETLTLAVKNMNEEKSLYTLMFLLMFFGALSANLGMQIIKDENAVVKQSVMLLPIPVLWVYHMQHGQ